MQSFRRAAAATTLSMLGSVGFAPAIAQTANDTTLQQLNRQIDEQNERLSAMRRTIDAEQARLIRLQQMVNDRALGRVRGGTDSNGQPLTDSANVPGQLAAGQDASRKEGPEVVGQSSSGGLDPVGRSVDLPRPNVAPIFEQPGVLTGKGHYVLEPSLQYSYSSNNRVALLGYTVIPALLVGLVDVREVKRNTTMAALTARVGITNRFELEGRIPYAYRSDATISREIATGSAADRVFSGSGKGLGDIEVAGRYQFNDGGADMPFFVGALRYKSRTGRDPFEVVTDCVTRCIGNTTGTGLPLSLPTGSGFQSLQPSLTWLLPSDPAVLFGTFSYLHNFKRNVTRTLLNGQQEALGTIAPGDVFGFNVGLGLSLNDRSSVSFGYDHSSVSRTRQNGINVPGSVRVQLGTLLLGYSQRLSDGRSVNVSVGAGLTRDTPDLTLTVRMPFSF